MLWWFVIFCVAPQDFCEEFKIRVVCRELYPTKMECVEQARRYGQIVADAVPHPVLWGTLCFDQSVTPRPIQEEEDT